jgi:hypothetical protein
MLAPKASFKGKMKAGAKWLHEVRNILSINIMNKQSSYLYWALDMVLGDKRIIKTDY